MSIAPVCEEAQLSECIEFKYSDIQRATNNFDESLVIGEGGFGKVYKGNIVVGESHDKLVVAIKHLKLSSHQGEREFLAEIGIQSKLRHTNLVSLIGYCKHKEQEMFIVLEYISKGSLEDRLLRQEYPPLTLVRRLQILIGTACGLNHLHTGTGLKHGVIHRDMKTANILLDDNWVAKICDFGISKTGPLEQTSNYIRGTHGRLDPDYLKTGVPTQKTDVYMFGMIMLEVLCGRRAIDKSFADPNQHVLTEWAQECFRTNMLAQIVDTNLVQGAGAIAARCLFEFVQLALRCLVNQANKRPTMADVVAGLETILATQKKANRKGIKAMKNKLLGGIKVLPYLIPFKSEKTPVGAATLKSLEFHLYTVGDENRILHQFNIDTINAASENFSIANRITYEDVNVGTMYKGKLQNGQAIAIFQPSDETQYELYKNETSILVNVEHENLIQLHGYCIDGTKVYFVYDFAPYATLDRLISGHGSAPFEWNQRYKILQGVGRVLCYLHYHAPVRVIHFDVKPGKIMLDENLNPKLFGFEFAKSIDMKEADCIKIGVAHRIAGCLAPEYICTNRMLSSKCDVFSFGMLVLETVTAERILEPSSADSLEINVRRKWWEGAYSNKAESEMTKRFIMVGLFCIQTDATQRPGMEEVVAMLMGTSIGTSDALSEAIQAMNKEEWEKKIKTRKTNSARSAKASTPASHP